MSTSTYSMLHTSRWRQTDQFSHRFRMIFLCNRNDACVCCSRDYEWPAFLYADVFYAVFTISCLTVWTKKIMFTAQSKHVLSWRTSPIQIKKFNILCQWNSWHCCSFIFLRLSRSLAFPISIFWMRLLFICLFFSRSDLYYLSIHSSIDVFFGCLSLSRLLYHRFYLHSSLSSYSLRQFMFRSSFSKWYKLWNTQWFICVYVYVCPRHVCLHGYMYVWMFIYDSHLYVWHDMFHNIAAATTATTHKIWRKKLNNNNNIFVY